MSAPAPPLELINFLALHGWTWSHRNFNFRKVNSPHYDAPMYLAHRFGRMFAFGAWEDIDTVGMRIEITLRGAP